jgi:hypothetical protein
MAWDANRRGDAASARQWAGEGREVSQQLATLRGELNCLEILTIAEREAGDYTAARWHLDEMWELSRPNGHPWEEGVARLGIGEVLARQGCYGRARISIERALMAFRTAGDVDRQATTLASLIRLYTILGEFAQVRVHLEPLDGLIATGVVQYNAAEHPWAGLDDPFELYLTCYRVLAAHRDPRASQVLCDRQERLQASAEQIDNLALRRSFMESVEAHRIL